MSELRPNVRNVLTQRTISVRNAHGLQRKELERRHRLSCMPAKVPSFRCRPRENRLAAAAYALPALRRKIDPRQQVGHTPRRRIKADKNLNRFFERLFFVFPQKSLRRSLSARFVHPLRLRRFPLRAPYFVSAITTLCFNEPSEAAASRVLVVERPLRRYAFHGE